MAIGEFYKDESSPIRCCWASSWCCLYFSRKL